MQGDPALQQATKAIEEQLALWHVPKDGALWRHLHGNSVTAVAGSLAIGRRRNDGYSRLRELQRKEAVDTEFMNADAARAISEAWERYYPHLEMAAPELTNILHKGGLASMEALDNALTTTLKRAGAQAALTGLTAQTSQIGR